MSGKVKVALFLDAEVAKALKVQSAWQGEGVSKLIHKIFTCAHCQRAITDEFVVGRPKLVTADRHGVFYHANKKECVKASGNRVVYIPICPHCTNPAYQQFDRVELYDALKKKSVRFYCISCDENWGASQTETIDLSRLLLVGADGEVAAREAALEAAYRALEDGRQASDSPEAMSAYHERVIERRHALQKARALALGVELTD